MGLTAACLWALGSGVYAVVRPLADFAARVAEYLVEPSDFAPEPAERATYILSCLLGPLLIAGFYEALRRAWDRFRPAPSARRLLLAASLLSLAAALAVSSAGDGLVYLERTPLRRPLEAAALAAALAVWLKRERGAVPLGRALGAVALALLGYGFFCRLVGGLELYVFHPHFQAVFSSVAQTRGGHPPLVGYAAQYGLYAVVLDPLFRVLGLGVFRFSAAMGALTVLSDAAILYFLARTLRRRWLAFLALIAAVFCRDFYAPAALFRRGVLDRYDPYFQYAPLRLLFPALALAFSADEAARHGRRRRVEAAVLALGCFWNLDSGAPALLGWLAALSFERLRRRTRAGRREALSLWFSAAAALLAWALALTLWIRTTSGAWPDWSLFVSFQRQFYLLGYYMIPMPPFHTWNIVVLLYGAGLLAAWTDSRDGRWDGRSRAALISSLIGLGIFSYYQGRSANTNLLLVATPAFCLISLGADRLLDAAGRDAAPWVPRAGAALAVLVLAGFAARGIADVPLFARGIRERVFERPEAYPGFASDESFLRARVAPGEKAEFLSYLEPVYRLATRCRTPAGPGIEGLYRTDDAERLFASILADPNTKVFSDGGVLDIDKPRTRPRANAAITRFLDANFRPSAFSPSGRILEFERLPLPGSPGANAPRAL